MAAWESAKASVLRKGHGGGSESFDMYDNFGDIGPPFSAFEASNIDGTGVRGSLPVQGGRRRVHRGGGG
jgi:hypothetical protein